MILCVPSIQSNIVISIINAQNLSGNTALHWAALNGHLESVKILIENGADPTITNKKGHDAIYEAELNDQKDVVDWVLQEGGECLEEAVGGASSSEGAICKKDEVFESHNDSERIADDLERVTLDSVKASS